MATSIDAETPVTRFFQNSVFGTIQWRKEYGRPNSANAAAAFKIRCYSGQGKGTSNPEDPHYWWLKIDWDVFSWDGPDDGEYHRVSFVSHVNPTLESAVTVGFIDGLVWDSGSGLHGARTLREEPPYLTIAPSSGAPTILSPFEVFPRGISSELKI